jgi:Tfp pilus assembly protein PilZ
MSVPITVFAVHRGQKVKQFAHTLDISRFGVRVFGVPFLDTPGQIATIEYSEQKAVFRVVWVGPEGTPAAGQVGLVAIKGEPYIWGVDLPSEGPDEHETLMLVPDRRQQEDRRGSPRLSSGGGVQCWKEGTTSCLYGNLGNLSRGGCFIETKTPFAPGTTVRLQFIVAGVKVCARGEVRNAQPGKGMGLTFKSFTEQDRQKLEAMLNSLVQKSRSTAKEDASTLMSRSDVLVLKLDHWFRQNESLSRDQYLQLLTGRQE